MQKFDDEPDKVVSSIGLALIHVEQLCQSLRWRLQAFPAGKIKAELATELRELVCTVCEVAVLSGQVEAWSARVGSDDSDSSRWGTPRTELLSDF